MGKPQFDAGALLTRARELADQFQFDAALKFYDRALEADQENAELLDEIANLLLRIGDMDRSRSYWQRSLQLRPNGGWQRYLNLAQLQEGLEAIALFNAGLQHMAANKEELERQLSATSSPETAVELADLTNKIANVHVSISEVYMTDACDEPNAESECERLITSAVAIADGTKEVLGYLNPEPLQALAGLRITLQRGQEAVPILEAIVSILENLEESEDRESRLPSLEFRINTAKLLMEVGMLEEASDLLSSLQLEAEDNVEIWFLLAQAAQMSGRPGAALEAVESGMKSYTKLQAMGAECDEFWLEELPKFKQEIESCIAERGADNDEDEEMET